MSPSSLEVIGTCCFALAVIHTFLVSLFKKQASKFKEGSIGENFFHLLGEVEIVFGLWAGIFLIGYVALIGAEPSVRFLQTRNFSEPVFVFAIMTVCATRPVIEIAGTLLNLLSQFFFYLSSSKRIYLSILFIGPLLGSFITEPAAMTLCALLMKKHFFDKNVNDRFRYITLAALLVNVSIGGVLTPYAAPPVLMVARVWNWDLSFMLENFGWKAAIACFINAKTALWLNRKSLQSIQVSSTGPKNKSPQWLTLSHLIVLTLLVFFHQYSVFVLGSLLFFLGFVEVTKEHQDEPKIRQSLLVSFFLAGLVVLGGLQGWWLAPILRNINDFTLFSAATALTAVTDNAALTYLGAQVQSLTDAAKYALVAGAVTGGGLTVIANAPNPAGFSILQGTFGKEGIHPGRLLLAALAPTAVAFILFWIF